MKMEKKKIIYNKQKEARKILYIPGVISMIWTNGACLYSVINKIYDKSETLFLIIILIPVIFSYVTAILFVIKRRYKLEIDFENETLSFCGGLQKQKQYDLKQIRINNTLSKFNKKEFMSFKKDIENIKGADKGE
jgi:hypothetical protein